jgi:hypothetical protein
MNVKMSVVIHLKFFANAKNALKKVNLNNNISQVAKHANGAPCQNDVINHHPRVVKLNQETKSMAELLVQFGFQHQSWQFKAMQARQNNDAVTRCRMHVT